MLGSSDVALNDVRTVMLKLPRAGAAASAAPEAGGEVAATEDVDTRSSTLDEFTTSVIRFRALGAQAVISANMSVAGDRGVLVQGTRGAIILPEPLIARPTHYILRQYAADGSTVEKEERCDFPIPGGGHG